MKSTTTGNSSSTGEITSKTQTDVTSSDVTEVPNKRDAIELIELKTTIKTLVSGVKKVNGQIAVIKEEQARLKEKTNESGERLTETLAIFVALFTFVSINFQFFSNQCLTPFMFIGLDLVLGGFLVMFIILLRIKGEKQEFVTPLFVAAIFMLIGGSIIGIFESPNLEKCRSYDTTNADISQPLIEQNYISAPTTTPSLTPTQAVN